MSRYSEPIMRKKFAGESLKAAKVKALKWVGKVACKDELQDLSFHFEEKKGEQFPTVVVTLSVSLEEQEVAERHCKICWEFHKHFFINENCNCTECKAKAVLNRIHDTLQVKKEYYKKNLRKMLEEMEQQ